MKKVSLVLIACVIVISILFGNVDTRSKTAPTVQAQDQVTVSWWHINTNDDQRTNWDNLAQEYMDAHPNVTIEITVLENEAFKTRLTTVMQAGDPPDLFQSWGGGVLWQYAEAGLVRDISPELEGEWYDGFAVPAAVELFQYEGGYYGVPWSWGAVGFFYNKQHFIDAGLDPEAPPQTWTEFLDAVDALYNAGYTPIALGEADKWTGHFWWVYLAIRTGGSEAFLNAFNRDGKFTDAPFVQAGELLEELIELEPFPENFMGLTYGDMARMLGDGESSMMLMGQWGFQDQVFFSESGGLGEDLGWFPFPMIEDGYEGVLGGGDGFAVGKNAPDAAVDFLRFLTNAENQRAMAEVGMIVPTNSEAQDAITEPVIQSVLEARNSATYFQLYYDQFLPPAVGLTVNDAVAGLFDGEYSPEEVTETIETQAEFELGN